MVANTQRHVNDPHFGLDTEVFDRELDRIKTDTQALGERPDYVDSEMMMRALYETAFGIHNHYGGKQHPFAPVAAYPKEDFAPYSSRFRDYARYMDERIFEATGIPLDSFFKRPRAEIETIFGLVRLRNKKQSASAEEIAAAAAKKMKEGKG